jgi:hypothetical protein
MKKIHVFLSHNLFEAANKPLREKSDVIELLLHTIPEIIIDESEDKNLGSCEIIVDKMSRIIYTLMREGVIYKKFSFTFPFNIRKDEEGEFSKWIVFDNTGRVINTQVASILLSLFNDDLFNNDISLDIEPLEFYDRIYEAIKEIDAELYITEVVIWHFIRRLFLFEPGYLRYDFDDDPDRCDEVNHPLHHLDFYFSSNATFKLGIAKDNQDFSNWKENSFESLLNIKDPCFYLKI